MRDCSLTPSSAEESNVFPSYPFASGNGSDEKASSKAADDIPFYMIGFKSAAPEYTLRTRIWASLRAQTLYRTVSGFMNYSKAVRHAPLDPEIRR